MNTPKVDNVNKLIERIRADQGRHFMMAGFVGYINEDGTGIKNESPTELIDCKTAFCLAGYANLIRMDEEGKAYRFKAEPNPHGPHHFNEFSEQFADASKAANWLGLNEEFNELFYMNGGSSQRDWFDTLPHEQKAETAITVLQHYRDTGDVDWNSALNTVVGQSYPDVDDDSDDE